MFAVYAEVPWPCFYSFCVLKSPSVGLGFSSVPAVNSIHFPFAFDAHSFGSKAHVEQHLPQKISVTRGLVLYAPVTITHDAGTDRPPHHNK